MSSYQKQASAHKCTLGRLLVVYNVISTRLLSNIIDALVLVRDQKISFAEAAEALKVCFLADTSLAEALSSIGSREIPSKHIKLGEMLVSAGMLVELDALTAAEIGLELRRPTGQVLCGSGIISQQLLRAALHLKMMVNGKTMLIEQAKELLQQVGSHLSRDDTGNGTRSSQEITSRLFQTS